MTAQDLRAPANSATIQGMIEDDLTPTPETDTPAEPAAEPRSAAEASPYTFADDAEAPAQDWVLGDIDAALAAVAWLSEIMPEREAEAEARADAKRSAPTFVPKMQMPPLATLKRGQLGSVVPALLLIGL